MKSGQVVICRVVKGTPCDGGYFVFEVWDCDIDVYHIPNRQERMSTVVARNEAEAIKTWKDGKMITGTCRENS